MSTQELIPALIVLTPALLMLAGSLLPQVRGINLPLLWRSFNFLCGVSLAACGLALVSGSLSGTLRPWLQPTLAGLTVAILVQFLGAVVGAFSSRYLEGEPGQRGYVAALARVLAAVQLLLLADHWALLIFAWAWVGTALQRLLCFYPDRPFALLAAHKKRIADRLADLLLLLAATFAWREVGTGSLSDLWAYLQYAPSSFNLQISALCLVLAVILRTALLPVHGWLIQVMEAPTPVSALLHAGVVNLGGLVLIRFAPLLEHSMSARALLVIFGLTTAALAGMVMLTRISIKVRLAWSTVAQMGFMLLECGLGLYTLALLHLIGHSLYKAHAFLSSSSAVRDTRLQAMRDPALPAPATLYLAPAVTVSVVLWTQNLSGAQAWPWWWSVILGLAWAPVLWMPVGHERVPSSIGLRAVAGLMVVSGLTGITLLGHALPIGIQDRPDTHLGIAALVGMSLLYLCLVTLQRSPSTLTLWRRWSYAGFYIDEYFTRLNLLLRPTAWAPRPDSLFHSPDAGSTASRSIL